MSIKISSIGQTGVGVPREVPTTYVPEHATREDLRNRRLTNYTNGIAMSEVKVEGETRLGALGELVQVVT